MVTLWDRGMLFIGMEFPAWKGGNIPAESPGKPLGLLISSQDLQNTQFTNSCSTGLNSRCLKVSCSAVCQGAGRNPKGRWKRFMDAWKRVPGQELTVGNGYGRKYSCLSLQRWIPIHTSHGAGILQQVLFRSLKLILIPREFIGIDPKPGSFQN